MEIHCPNCGCEDAFFNGVSYECPECDYTWGGNDGDDDDEW